MKLTIIASVLAGLTSLAHADLNADAEKKAAQEDLAKQLKATNDACGTKITASYDSKSETKKPTQAGLGWGVCREAAHGIADVCEDHPDAKKTVADKVKKIDCRFDASVSSKKSEGTGIATDLAGTPPVPHTWLDLANGTLSLSFDWQMANTRTEVATYLTKAL